MEVHPGWHKFQIGDELGHTVLNWLLVQNKTFCAGGISNLPRRWKKCVRVKREYLEKKCEFADPRTYVPFCKNKGHVNLESPAYRTNCTHRNSGRLY